MKFEKISRINYNILTRDTINRWFFINKNNQYEFKNGIYKGIEVLMVYNSYEDSNDFIEYLQYIYDNSNWKDRKAIYEIYKNIK